MRDIDTIVIHCSATPNGDGMFRGKPGEPGFQTPVEVIDGWHRARGFQRQERFRQRWNPTLTSIGYHFVIYKSGVTVTGRSMDEVGAHAKGHNARSIGICMLGTDQFTPQQWKGLSGTVFELLKLYPTARVVGHRDLSPDRNGNGIVEPHEWLKTCPGFDVEAWMRRGQNPDPQHVLEV